MSTKIEILKTVTSTIVGFGAGSIVKSVIDHNTDPDENPAEKAASFLGAIVIGSMVKDAAKKHTDAKIDQAVALYKKHITDKKSPDSNQ